MSKKKVLLARPSSLLVNNMKRLMESASLEPIPFNQLDFNVFSKEEIAGIVISTALTSTVKQEYCEVMKMAHEQFSDTPKFLASYSSYRRAQLIAASKFCDIGLEMDAISIEEASQRTEIDFRSTYIIITREDLEDESKFPTSLAVINHYMNHLV